MKDLDAYLDRIGLGGADPTDLTPARVHRAHTMAIPFENLDPLRGVPVSLEPGAVEEKLVARRRGGYCFEHNTLLADALTALGLGEVEYVLGRVRMGVADPGRPLTHLLLRVTVEGQVWHHDVGFGRDTLHEPIPFGSGPEIVQDGWRYRVVDDGPEHVLQIWRDGAWFDLYGFEPRAVRFVELEVANWYAGTSPRSPFTNRVHVGVQEAGRRCFVGTRDEGLVLTERTPGSVRERPVDPSELPGILAGFGIADPPLPG